MGTPDHLGAIGCDDGSEIRLTLGSVKGWPVLDVRSFEQFSPAAAMTGSKRGIAIPLDRLDDFISALDRAAAEISNRGAP